MQYIFAEEYSSSAFEKYIYLVTINMNSLKKNNVSLVSRDFNSCIFHRDFVEKLEEMFVS